MRLKQRQPICPCADPKLRTMSKMRSRSRSRVRSRSISSPRTPPTPSDAFQVSGDEDELVMAFDCKVIMTSGENFGSFRCDQHTTMGYVRNCVMQIVTKMRNKGLLREFESFRLLRGEQICKNDYNKIFEMFTNEDCVLTLVMLRVKEE